MAEDLPRAGGDRRLLIVVIAVIVIILGFFLFSFRSCAIFGRDNGYITIYSDLDLKDSANVVTRLKDLKIPYEIKGDGTAVAVPKERADEARLGLAEKNLPLGGVVGWEIFDESKLGATDFDRRVQLIRAISGELSRTIRRIEAVEDCRVQIVLPETKLFEATQAPVTASVLLRLKAGLHLSPSQVNGIVHLVASSVENLQPQNVTIIDDRGKILSNIVQEKLVESVRGENAASSAAEIATAPVIAPVISKETVVIKTVEAQAQVIPMSPEERALMRVRAKEEMEKQLTVSTQYLLDKFYPPNTVIVRVAVELKDEAPENSVPAKLTSAEAKDINLGIRRIFTIVLVDDKFVLPEALKKSTYATIVDTVGYNAKRGDRIILRKEPFYYATGKRLSSGPITAAVSTTEPVNSAAVTIESTAQSGRTTIIILSRSLAIAKKIALFAKKTIGLRRIVIGFVSLIGLWIVFSFFRRVFGRQKPKLEMTEEPEFDAGTTLNSIKNAAEQSPEKIANLLKSWLTEE